MFVNHSSYGYTFEDLNTIIEGNFDFHAKLPISKKSSFGDSKWDFSDEYNQRLKVVTTGNLLFDWNSITIKPRENKQLSHHQKFHPFLPEKIIEDIKRTIFISLLIPNTNNSKNKRRVKKGVTVISQIKAIVNFFSYIYLTNKLPNGNFDIRKISDITISDIKRASSDYPYRVEELKRILQVLASDYTQRNLKYGKLSWTALDLKTIRWKPKKEYEPIKSLPDKLFTLLSNKSSELITEFLNLLGEEVKDNKTINNDQNVENISRSNLTELFESYIERRNILVTKGKDYVRNHTTKFVKQFGFNPEELYEYLYNVQCAAQNIILLYTGMRYSEAASITTGCLITKNDICLIKSTLIKSVPSNMPVDQDEWIAIDIVQDAIKTLELLSKCTFNSFLFSDFETVKGKDNDEQPISSSGLKRRLNTFLRRIDVEKKWEGWKLSPHQYRHGLAYQLAKAEVGIPYITRQLKHFHTTLLESSYKINQVTTVYGMQKEVLINSITPGALKQVGQEVLNDLYGEGKKFAGGGAEKHIERTETFFRGIALEGMTREEYINELSEAGVVVIRTGIGWCTRNHVDPKQLKENPPPCIGDLMCNPQTCEHSVVPISRKADLIKRYINAKKQLIALDQQYLKEHWLKEINAYKSMLQQLEVDIDKLD